MKKKVINDTVTNLGRYMQDLCPKAITKTLVKRSTLSFQVKLKYEKKGQQLRLQLKVTGNVVKIVISVD